MSDFLICEAIHFEGGKDKFGNYMILEDINKRILVVFKSHHRKHFRLKTSHSFLSQYLRQLYFFQIRWENLCNLYVPVISLKYEFQNSGF